MIPMVHVPSFHCPISCRNGQERRKASWIQSHYAAYRWRSLREGNDRDRPDRFKDDRRPEPKSPVCNFETQKLPRSSFQDHCRDPSSLVKLRKKRLHPTFTQSEKRPNPVRLSTNRFPSYCRSTNTCPGNNSLVMWTLFPDHPALPTAIVRLIGCLLCLYRRNHPIPLIHSAIRVPGITVARIGMHIKQRRTAIAPILMMRGDGDVDEMSKETFRMNTLTADSSGDIALVRIATVAPSNDA
jgi:hypothetical protein